jgi:hypothetical protein
MSDDVLTSDSVQSFCKLYIDKFHELLNRPTQSEEEERFIAIVPDLTLQILAAILAETAHVPKNKAFTDSLKATVSALNEGRRKVSEKIEENDIDYITPEGLIKLILTIRESLKSMDPIRNQPRFLKISVSTLNAVFEFFDTMDEPLPIGSYIEGKLRSMEKSYDDAFIQKGGDFYSTT